MKTKMLIALFFYLHSALVMAQGLTYETYVQADLFAREKTLDGMQQQVELLTMGASEGQLHLAAAANQAEVESVFESYGTTSSQHAAYGTQNQKAIAAWLNAHAQWQAIYQELDDLFNLLSQQIATLREGQ